MLLRMQASTAPVPSPRSREFAGMLMDLAAPEAKKPPVRDFDGLEEDVATLSYEEALRQHGRYRPTVANTGPQLASHVPFVQPPSATAPVAPSVSQVDRRTASVTVRLCHAESERLRQRAAESGLTVSEYLRSCVFEVESLRAQVKETLAALRGTQQAQRPSRRAWSRAWSRAWWRIWWRSSAAPRRNPGTAA